MIGCRFELDHYPSMLWSRDPDPTLDLVCRVYAVAWAMWVLLFLALEHSLISSGFGILLTKMHFNCTGCMCLTHKSEVQSKYFTRSLQAVGQRQTDLT